MIINDVIKEILFKSNYNRNMIFIQMNSMFEKNNRPRNKNNVIRCIFSEKLCRFLRINFEINSTFDIFQTIDDKKMTMQKN